MKRYSVCILSILAIVCSESARGELTCSTVREGANDIAVFHMVVTPAAEPVPALQYRLMARDIDLKPGNAVPYYYRALLDTPATLEHVRKDFGDDYDKWYITGSDGTPIEKLPLDKVRKAVEMTTGGATGQQLAVATSRRDCNWELGVEQLAGPDVVSYLLGEFARSRDIGRAISLRARLAVAEHHYNDALDALRMNIRLGRDVANVPFIVCGLIGIAIEGIADGPLVDFIASPESPNLYWALTELPQPLIDLRPAARFESDFGPRLFPFIRDTETTARSAQEWNRLFAHVFRDLGRIGLESWKDSSNQSDAEVGVAATGLGLLGYSHAKEQLIAQGMDRDRIEKMAVAQVIAIYTERNYTRFADDWQKLWYVPFPEMSKMVDAIAQRTADSRFMSDSPDRELFPMVSLLLPAIQNMRTAQVRLEREIAALRVIEALRMYAARHDGQLPKSLDDINEVPVPVNPATGKLFAYRLDGKTAVLELPPSDGLIAGNQRFEIQIAADKK